MNRIGLTRYVYLALLFLALALLGNATYMTGKAWLAQRLINHSWQQAMQSGETVRPWPWADTWPVSRLLMPQHDVDLIVLAGDDGRALAFAPGARLSMAMPGETGTSIISAHRDTHFAFLQQVKVGERFLIQDQQGKWWQYRITRTEILPQPQLQLPADESSQLLMVTCYPFDVVTPGGPQRFVVYAEKLPGERRLI